MITLKSPAQIERMRAAGALVYQAIQEVHAAVRPGVTTQHLDDIAERVIRGAGGIPSFKNYRGFPASICVSIDDEVVHGIPGKRVLEEGMIVGVDIGAVLEGYHGDSARTFAVGRISPEAQRLIEATERCFWLAVEQAHEGNRVGDISHAVQAYAESCGYGVVRELCGHGVGQKLHEDPEVPNFGRPGFGERLRRGMVIAVEPMINAGRPGVSSRENGTVVTRDGSLSAHFEHTIAITADGKLPELLTLPDGGAWKEARE